MHKGFKCLDPSEGRVYISRDMVFDERVFPFAQFHPNTGAQLRAELSLLPDILLNPIASFEDAKLLDQCDVSMSTNGVQDAGTVVVETGEKDGNSRSPNLGNNGGGWHFMRIPGGDSAGTEHESDPPVAVSGHPIISPPGSEPKSSVMAPCSTAPTDGSSVAS